MKHKKSARRSSGGAFIITLAVVLLVVLLGIALFWKYGMVEPEPMGTAKTPPMADQRPVPSSSVSQSSVSQSSLVSSSTAPSDSTSEEVPVISAPKNPAKGASAVVDDKTEHVLRGVITDATTSTVTIKDAQGNTYGFLRETADVTGRLVEGAEVDITYLGSIEGGDTSNAYVTKIVAYA